MVIAVDMDNTLNNFTEGVIEYALDRGVSLANVRKPMDSWHIFNILYPDNSEKMADEIMSTPGFWLDLKPLPYSHYTLRYLQQKATVAIVTKPWPSYNCIPEKLTWIKKHYPFFDTNNVVFTHNKDLVPVDYIIEDNPENYKNMKNSKLVLMDQEYNQNDHCTVRVKSWREIEEYFRNENL